MRTRQPHVLVVDDAPGVCALVDAALADAGMRVSSAVRPDQAREILARGGVDLALVDIVLAGESGLAIAQHAVEKGARVLLMSGFPDAAEADLPFPFIAKPFNMRELVDVATFLTGDVTAG